MLNDNNWLLLYPGPASQKQTSATFRNAMFFIYACAVRPLGPINAKQGWQTRGHTSDVRYKQQTTGRSEAGPLTRHIQADHEPTV
jgi:hypothetical protein